MTARFTAGLSLTVALGFIMTWRDKTLGAGRIPLAVLWVFATVALASAAFVLATGNSGPGGPIIVLGRPFPWVWFILYVASVTGGFYYHTLHPKVVLRTGAAP